MASGKDDEMPGRVQRLTSTEQPASELVRQEHTAGAAGPVQHQNRLSVGIAQNGVAELQRRNGAAVVETEVTGDELAGDGRAPRCVSRRRWIPRGARLHGHVPGESARSSTSRSKFNSTRNPSGSSTNT